MRVLNQRHSIARRAALPVVALASFAALSGCRTSERSPSAHASRSAVAASASRPGEGRTPEAATSAQAPPGPSGSNAAKAAPPGDAAEPWVRLTVVMDTIPGRAGLRRAWGISVLVEDHDDTVLFDTGPDGTALLHNLEQLEIDVSRIDAVVLSHIHHDHVGGTEALLRKASHPRVFVPPSFPAAFQQAVRSRATEVEVAPGTRVGSALLSTGELPGPPGEQALIIRTTSGLVVVTGCSHPGVVRLVERARELAGPRVRLVLGGFHLGSALARELDRVASGLRELGVEQVAPCHCTGPRAIQRLRDEYGVDCLEVRLGEPLAVGAPAATDRK